MPRLHKNYGGSSRRNRHKYPLWQGRLVLAIMRLFIFKVVVWLFLSAEGAVGLHFCKTYIGYVPPLLTQPLNDCYIRD